MEPAGIQTSKSQGPEEKKNELPSLSDLIEELECVLTTYINFPDPTFATLCALWVVQTYSFHAFSYCGYLALRSSTPGCGKTRLLSILRLFCSGKPSIYTNVSPAVLFRIQKNVLLLDEVDKLRNQDKEKAGDIQAILNAGFQKDGVVARVVGREFQVKEFPVYGPKALAGIESLADTLADRAFHIQMKREKNRSQRFNERKFEEQARGWRENCQRWVDERFSSIEQSYQEIPYELDVLKAYEARFQDISEPLFILAQLADIERTDNLKDCELEGYEFILSRLLKGLKLIAAKRQPSSRERQLRAFLKMVEPHLNGNPSVFLRTTNLLEMCIHCDELEWIDTSRKLANFIKYFELYPTKRRMDTEVIRGYDITAAWVTDWRERYEH